jgi:hypothetical protein
MMMYSPKISEDLIHALYRIGKREKEPMTKVVDRFLRKSITDYLNENAISSEEVSADDIYDAGNISA